MANWQSKIDKLVSDIGSNSPTAQQQALYRAYIKKRNASTGNKADPGTSTQRTSTPTSTTSNSTSNNTGSTSTSTTTTSTPSRRTNNTSSTPSRKTSNTSNRRASNTTSSSTSSSNTSRSEVDKWQGKIDDLLSRMDTSNPTPQQAELYRQYIQRRNASSGNNADAGTPNYTGSTSGNATQGNATQQAGVTEEEMQALLEQQREGQLTEDEVKGMLNEQMEQYMEMLKQQNPQMSEEQIGAIRRRIANQANAMYKNQKAQIESNYSSYKSDLESTYQDAILEQGEAKRDTQEYFEENQDAINQNSYLQSERNNVIGSQRGISNSQQFMGMDASRESRTAGLHENNTSDRASRLANISDRISNLMSQKDIALTDAENQYNSQLTGAQAQADLYESQANLDFDMNNYQYNRQRADQVADREDSQRFQEGMQETQQGYALERMFAQHDLNVENMDRGHMQELERLSQVQGFQEHMSDKSFAQQLTKIDKQHANSLNVLSENNAFREHMADKDFARTLVKMDKQQANNLATMAKSQGFQMAMADKSYAQQLAKMDKASTMRMAEYADKLDLQMEQTKQAYQQQIQQQLNQYTPGTPEHELAKAQSENEFSSWVEGMRRRTYENRYEIMENSKTEALNNAGAFDAYAPDLEDSPVPDGMYGSILRFLDNSADFLSIRKDSDKQFKDADSFADAIKIYDKYQDDPKFRQLAFESDEDWYEFTRAYNAYIAGQSQKNGGISNEAMLRRILNHESNN